MVGDARRRNTPKDPNPQTPDDVLSLELVPRDEASALAAQRYADWLREEQRDYERTLTTPAAVRREEAIGKFPWLADSRWRVGGLKAGHPLTAAEKLYLGSSPREQQEHVAAFLPPGVLYVPRGLVDYIAWAKINWHGSLPLHKGRTVPNTEPPFAEAADAVVLPPEGEVLVGWRQDGTIGLPAGFMDAGEELPYHLAAGRELEEEAGVELPYSDRFTLGRLSTTGSALSFTGTVFNRPDRDPRIRVVSFPSAAVVEGHVLRDQMQPGEDLVAVGLMSWEELMSLHPSHVWADTQEIVKDSILGHVQTGLRQVAPEHPMLRRIEAFQQKLPELEASRAPGPDPDRPQRAPVHPRHHDGAPPGLPPMDVGQREDLPIPRHERRFGPRDSPSP